MLYIEHRNPVAADGGRGGVAEKFLGASIPATDNARRVYTDDGVH
jgi:hypothetical protein